MKIYLAGTESRPWVLGGGEEIKVYLAESGDLLNCYIPPEMETKANILQSYFYIEKHGSAAHNAGNFLLDSGAFTFLTQGKHIVWEEYTDRYCQYINDNNIDKFFEMDIDSIVGYDRVLELRKRIERQTNKQPIPVWHKSRGWDAYVRECQEYPYVALGGIAIKELKKSDYAAFPAIIGEAHKWGAKIHGLGFTQLSLLDKYHFDSVDSTAWVAGNRFGYIYEFDGKSMRKHQVPQGKRLADAKAVAIHNFSEWVKFCNYAEEHL